MKTTPGERGQALVETAMVVSVAVVIIAGILSFGLIHRTRTAATSAAYACAQFLSQNPDPVRARQVAYDAAMSTLKGGWSGTGTAEYEIAVIPPSGRGQPGTCRVSWRIRPMFAPMDFGWSTEVFTSRNETWSADW